MALLHSGCGGSGQAGPSNQAATNTPPTISGTPLSLTYEDTDYSFAPRAADGDGDTLLFSVANLPAWARFDPQSGRIDGRPGPTDAGSYRSIQISVSDGADTARLPAFDLLVDPVYYAAFTLSWNPPTQNTDDSPLQNLAGFHLYWGKSTGAYPNELTLMNPGLTSYVFTNLAPGKYHFATTAVNSYGRESELSDDAVIMIR